MNPGGWLARGNEGDQTRTSNGVAIARATTRDSEGKILVEIQLREMEARICNFTTASEYSQAIGKS
jgi:hypothetical protein